MKFSEFNIFIVSNLWSIFKFFLTLIGFLPPPPIIGFFANTVSQFEEVLKQVYLSKLTPGGFYSLGDGGQRSAHK